jgi:DNA helicase-2/ATP-dependent DNA helicase PcrA
MNEAALLENLNDEQKAAVTHKDGPLLIVAGAGTGKTTVITRRLAWLIHKSFAAPDELLALTFTEKAAAEMEERIDKLLPMGYVDLWALTFHGFCERILREHALEIGLDPGFKVLSQAETWLFLREHLYDFNLEYYRPLGNPTRFLYALISHFSRAKDENISPIEYLEYAGRLEKTNAELVAGETDEDKKQVLQEEMKKTREIADAYTLYQKLMAEAGNMDFGDLILYTLKLFKDRKSLLQKYREKFKYILVDEFQDTNFAQYELVKLLANPKDNLTVCGDDDQSIYKFRGAAVSNILGFKRDFPKAKDVVLTKNYRSTQAILDVAYQSIQLNNPERLETKLNISKKLLSQSEKGDAPNILHYETEYDEAMGVTKTILDLREKDQELAWSDFAILVRSNAQAEQFTEILDRKSIPYQFVASRGLFAEPIIMDMCAYLRILNNPFDNISAFRVLSSPFFSFDMLDVTKLQAEARRKNIPLLDALQEVDSFVGVEESTKTDAKKLIEMVEKHAGMAKTKTAGKILYQFIGDTGQVRKLLQEDSASSKKKILNIAEFFKMIRDFETANANNSLSNFLDELDLLQEAGEDPAPANPEEGPDMVSVMTVHSAKGLEFEYVFVVNLVSDRFPSRSRGEAIPLPKELIREALPEEDAHIQEERRLFYVALTRAKRGLYLTNAKDYGGKRKKKPSIFLQETQSLLDIKDVPVLDPLQEETKEEPEKKQDFELVLPSKFSYTQLAAFETCPRQYQYAHVYKIQPPGRHTLSYGKSIHSTLEQFYKNLQEGRQLTKDEFLKLFEDCWISDWYDSKAQEKKQKDKGRDSLSHYFDEHAEKFVTPLFVEKEFNLKMGEYTFKGKIDRIDPLQDGVAIVDYKTGKVKKQKDVDSDEQLSLYALAAKRVLGLEPKRLSLYFMDEGVRVDTERTEEDLKKFEAKVIETIDALKESRFVPTPGRQCSFCDFLNICEAGMKTVRK